MIKRHKELKQVQGSIAEAVSERGYIPKSGGHVGKSYGTMTIICYVKWVSTKMILNCSSCNKDYYTSKTEDDKTPLLTDCQCHNEGIDKSVKLSFHNKKLIKGDNEYWCTGCESYRGIHKRESRYCDICTYISKNVLTLYETFDEIMERWEPTTHKPCTMKLPYLSGTSTKGFKVRGFTYISVEDYEWCSKLHWIKVKCYIKASCSIANGKRVTEDIKEIHGKYLFLHRHVLRLQRDDKVLGDHINNLTLDNRKGNLRVATAIQNSSNSRPAKGKKSKYKGVTYSENGSKCWRATLYIMGKYYYRFCFTEKEAAIAYNMLLETHRPSEFNVYNKVE